MIDWDHPNLNDGLEWSPLDIRDLRYELAEGSTIEEAAAFLCRKVRDVYEKAKELGLNPRSGNA